MTKARDISKLLSTANGKIAGENLDVSFENITDTGTEGTRVATGTTAQRGSTAGQLRFNSQTGLAEYYDGSQFKAIDAPPTVSSIDVTEVDSQAGGNQTIVITGSGFNSGATVTFIGASGTDFNASTVTVDSDTQITAVAPKSSFLNAQEPYGVRVTNVSGLSGILASQINVDSSPSWQTASGNLGTVDEGSSANFTVSATDADGDTVSYSETTSSLSGAGFSLNPSTGAITGTANLVSGDTTTSFTLRATANSKTSDRSFSIITKNIISNALLWDATNITTQTMPNANGLGLNGLLPNTAVTLSNVRGSSGTLADGYLVTDKQDTWGHYTHSDGRDSTIGDTFWSVTKNRSSHDNVKYASWFGSHNGDPYGNTDMWFAMDFGDNPSFRINRLAGYTEWRTASADFYFYGTNDISNLNGNTGNSDAGSMTTTGLTLLNTGGTGIQSVSWNTGTFTNNTFYRYYIWRVLASGSPYDWGMAEAKIYGDYY